MARGRGAGGGDDLRYLLKMHIVNVNPEDPAHVARGGIVNSDIGVRSNGFGVAFAYGIRVSRVSVAVLPHHAVAPGAPRGRAVAAGITSRPCPPSSIAPDPRPAGPRGVAAP